jgi:hypothetical protein
MQYLEKRDNFILIGSQLSILGRPTKYGADLSLVSSKMAISLAYNKSIFFINTKMCNAIS